MSEAKKRELASKSWLVYQAGQYKYEVLFINYKFAEEATACELNDLPHYSCTAIH